MTYLMRKKNEKNMTLYSTRKVNVKFNLDLFNICREVNKTKSKNQNFNTCSKPELCKIKLRPLFDDNFNNILGNFENVEL